MDITIRECQTGDLPRLLELYQHLHVKDAPCSEAPILERVWQELLNDPKIHLLAGEVNGVLVCTCVLVIVPNLSRGARPYGLIENVVTHSLYRRRGYGTAVLQHALDIAWKLNCYKVMLLTGRQDENIFRFYEGAGFKPGIKAGFIATPGT
jgi:GNAT superfamily N-acetyltransferase